MSGPGEVSLSFKPELGSENVNSNQVKKVASSASERRSDLLGARAQEAIRKPVPYSVLLPIPENLPVTEKPTVTGKPIVTVKEDVVDQQEIFSASVPAPAPQVSASAPQVPAPAPQASIPPAPEKLSFLKRAANFLGISKNSTKGVDSKTPNVSTPSTGSAASQSSSYQASDVPDHGVLESVLKVPDAATLKEKINNLEKTPDKQYDALHLANSMVTEFEADSSNFELDKLGKLGNLGKLGIYEVMRNLGNLNQNVLRFISPKDNKQTPIFIKNDAVDLTGIPALLISYDEGKTFDPLIIKDGQTSWEAVLKVDKTAMADMMKQVERIKHDPALMRHSFSNFNPIIFETDIDQDSTKIDRFSSSAKVAANLLNVLSRDEKLKHQTKEDELNYGKQLPDNCLTAMQDFMQASKGDESLDSFVGFLDEKTFDLPNSHNMKFTGAKKMVDVVNFDVDVISANGTAVLEAAKNKITKILGDTVNKLESGEKVVLRFGENSYLYAKHKNNEIKEVNLNTLEEKNCAKNGDIYAFNNTNLFQNLSNKEREYTQYFANQQAQNDPGHASGSAVPEKPVPVQLEGFSFKTNIS